MKPEPERARPPASALSPAERHQLMTELMQAALDCEPAERDEFLIRACAGDEDLRRDVASLIASYEQAASFIETPALDRLNETLADEETAFAGRRIGPYRLTRELGHGGMGAVYLAVRDDDEFQQRVAVKLVRRGMDTDFVVRRFRAERQILAALDHPNIARLLDGGTTEDGLPYFVMEYIEGEPLTDYCDRQRLSTAERLRLFRTVCAAVHYAHQNLIIHRDLKPSNILVTAEGVPKLLDFGIAKILNPTLARASEPTMTAVRLMTPEYASPEQVQGAPITTASDVYSLGVVLYELLTGHHPYRLRSFLPHDMAQAICEQEPMKPSTAVTRAEEVGRADGLVRTLDPADVSARRRESQPDKLRRRLRGDLDNIVLMALRKEPSRRYASVEHLSEDVRRHIEGLPVTARHDTLGYRSGKFIKRHKAGVAAAALIVLSLVAGLITTIWQARRAATQQARAERRLHEVRQLAGMLLFEFHDAIEKLPGTTPARELLVKRALQVYDDLAQETSAEPTLRRELATAYLKVGDVQGRPGYANLGDKAGALRSYRRALEIRESLAAAGPLDAEARHGLAEAYLRLGDVSQLSGDTKGAMEQYRKALEVADATQAEGRRDVASGRQRLGEMLARTGNVAGAVEQQRQALALYESLAASATDERARRDASREMAIAEVKMGNLLAARGDRAGALGRYRQALPIYESLVAAERLNFRYRRELAAVHDRVGNILIALGDRPTALAEYRAALKIREPLAEDDPQNAEIKRDISISHDKIGGVLAVAGDTAGAIASYRAALKIDTALAADGANAQAKLDCASSLEKIGDLLARFRDLPGALDSHRHALALREQVTSQDPADLDARRDLASSHVKIGETLSTLAKRGARPTAAQQWREAAQSYQRGLDMLRELQQRGALSQDDAGEIERVARALAICETALKR